MTTVAPDPEFDALLEHLKQTRGFDFTNYKRSGLIRRILRRMSMLQIDGFSEYQDYLEVHPAEFSELFDTILINVTAFFRDPEQWQYIEEEVVPRILFSKQPGDPVRVWSAGCSSGEEAYTTAMVLAEAMGWSAFRERVKIYGIDVDDQALTAARLGVYGAREIKGISPVLLDRYFDHVRGQYIFNKDLRRSVIFGQHDLMRDAPISRVDLLICRNTLMYFNGDAQAHILSRFQFALNDGGFLFLGRAEMLLNQEHGLVPVELKRRVFAKRSGRGVERLMPLGGRRERTGQADGAEQVLEATFETTPVPQVVVDRSGLLAIVNEQARHVFGLTRADVGRPFRDLELSYRWADLRAMVERALRERAGHRNRDSLYGS